MDQIAVQQGEASEEQKQQKNQYKEGNAKSTFKSKHYIVKIPVQ